MWFCLSIYPDRPDLYIAVTSHGKIFFRGDDIARFLGYREVPAFTKRYAEHNLMDHVSKSITYCQPEMRKKVLCFEFHDLIPILTKKNAPNPIKNIKWFTYLWEQGHILSAEPKGVAFHPQNAERLIVMDPIIKINEKMYPLQDWIKKYTIMVKNLVDELQNLSIEHYSKPLNMIKVQSPNKEVQFKPISNIMKDPQNLFTKLHNILINSKIIDDDVWEIKFTPDIGPLHLRVFIDCHQVFEKIFSQNPNLEEFDLNLESNKIPSKLRLLLNDDIIFEKTMSDLINTFYNQNDTPHINQNESIYSSFKNLLDAVNNSKIVGNVLEMKFTSKIEPVRLYILLDENIIFEKSFGKDKGLKAYYIFLKSKEIPQKIHFYMNNDLIFEKTVHNIEYISMDNEQTNVKLTVPAIYYLSSRNLIQ